MMNKNEKELINELKTLLNHDDRRVQNEAKIGLKYKDKLQGMELRDMMRHQIYKANQSLNPRTARKPSYEGRVLDETSVNTSNCTGYTVIDVTSFNGNSIQAGFINATTIEADSVNATVLDANSVTANTVQANTKNISSQETLKEKKKREKEHEKKKKKREKKAKNLMDDFDFKNSNERKIVKKTLENVSNPESMAEKLKNNKNPHAVLQSAGNILRNQYTRPPKRPNKPVVEFERRGLEVYVSNVSPPSGAGNTMHQGNWVQLRYDASKGIYKAMYTTNGIAGNSDDIQTFSMDEVSSDKLVTYAKDKLPFNGGIL